MPQSLHKILLHGYEIIQRMSLPIGLMSEETQEARNKDFKKYREHFARKFSREKTNEDLLKRLLCSSDPVISSMRKIATNKKFKHFPADVLTLIKQCNPQ